MFGTKKVVCSKVLQLFDESSGFLQMNAMRVIRMTHSRLQAGQLNDAMLQFLALTAGASFH